MAVALSPPSGTPIGPWLVDLLRPHTPFAESIVRRQVERAGLVFETLTPEDLPKLGPMIVNAASFFVDPSALASLKAVLGVKK